MNENETAEKALLMASELRGLGAVSVDIEAGPVRIRATFDAPRPVTDASASSAATGRKSPTAMAEIDPYWSAD